MGHKWTLKLASSGPLKVVTVYRVTKNVHAGQHKKRGSFETCSGQVELMGGQSASVCTQSRQGQKSGAVGS